MLKKLHDRICPRRGRPIDETKRDLILQIATELFMHQGFNNTSMDQIAKKAGMSKLTLYNRFPDKNALFTAVIEGKCQEYIPDEIFDVFDHKPLREALYTVGHALFSLIMSDDAIYMYRMMAAEATHNPKLTQLFYDTGPKRVKGLMTEKMQMLKDKKLLKMQDASEAKEIFASLFTGSDLFMKRLMNIGAPPSKKQLDQHVHIAVDFFIGAYT